MHGAFYYLPVDALKSIIVSLLIINFYYLLLINNNKVCPYTISFFTLNKEKKYHFHLFLCQAVPADMGFFFLSLEMNSPPH